jgi:hypothetical protein
MDNSTSELLYVAYKNLLLRNIETGLFNQHSSDSDYYIVDKMPKLLFEILDVFWNKYSTNDFLAKFYQLNPHRSQDIEFSKQVFSKIRNYSDFQVLVKNVGEDAFINDTPLLKTAFEKVGSILITSCDLTKLKINQEFMESIYYSDNFSLTYFDLPAPTDDTLVKNILEKDPKSFSKLNHEQQSNIDYAIIALKNSVEKTPKIVEEKIYKFIPDELRTNKEIAILSSKVGIANQPLIAFTYENVLSNTLDGIHNKSSRNKIDILKIDEIPIDVYKNAQNIFDLFAWMTKESQSIDPTYDNYAKVYKSIKAIAKINPYVKEQFSKDNSKWNKGTLGEVKNGTKVFFREYFQQSIPEITNELRYYVMANELTKDLTQNEEKTKRMKL